MRITGRTIISVVPLLAELLIRVPSARSQSAVTLIGNVADESGGSVQGAPVRLYSRKGLRETKADIHGEFEFTYVELGKYVLEVAYPGFKRAARDLEISDLTSRPVAIKLRVGVGGHCTVKQLGCQNSGMGNTVFLPKWPCDSRRPSVETPKAGSRNKPTSKLRKFASIKSKRSGFKPYDPSRKPIQECEPALGTLVKPNQPSNACCTPSGLRAMTVR